jgi:tRNA threonylcarbamoyladenosine biosynthesis protein TsaE
MTAKSETFTSTSPEETMAWAMAWAHTLAAGTVIALHGNLGAGKTCFVQGLARGLDVKDNVHSPTFTLINEYRGTLPLYHLDLYRLRSEEDAWEIGIEDYLSPEGITVIEWADRIQRILPAHTIHIMLENGDQPNERRIYIVPTGAI